MNEQIVSFETAQLAKEKGFDLECEKFYKENNVFGDSFEFYKNSTLMGIGNHHPDNKHWLTYCTAPTQSFLQKWLRDVQNIFVCPVLYEDYIQWCVIIYVKQNEQSQLNTKHTYIKDVWKTYEQALEEGLQEALKLINK